MSIWGHRVSTRMVLVGALLVSAGVLLPAMVLQPAREITLVARGMAFYLEEDPRQPNPTITVRAGERLRLVLRNEDRGYTHDLAVPVVGAATRLADWQEQREVVFVAPDRPGRYEYICTPHRLMMAGTLVVTAD